MNCINIYTDGSHSDRSSSWGFLINHHKNPIMNMGVLPNFFRTPSASEAISIVKALEFFVETEQKDLVLQVFTDCQSLVSVKRNRRYVRGSCVLTYALRNQIRTLIHTLKKSNIKVHIKYVRAHTLKDNSEKVICNRVVDISVRKLMRKQRNHILKKEESLLFRVKAFFQKNYLEKEEVSFWLNHGGWAHLPEISLPKVAIKTLTDQAHHDVKINLRNIKRQESAA